MRLAQPSTRILPNPAPQIERTYIDCTKANRMCTSQPAPHETWSHKPVPRQTTPTRRCFDHHYPTRDRRMSLLHIVRRAPVSKEPRSSLQRQQSSSSHHSVCWQAGGGSSKDHQKPEGFRPTACCSHPLKMAIVKCCQQPRRSGRHCACHQPDRLFAIRHPQHTREQSTCMPA